MQSLVRSGKFIWYIFISPQIKTLPLGTHNTQVLQDEQKELKMKIIAAEKDMWKTKFDEMINNQSVTEKEVLMQYRHRRCLLYITNNNLSLL